MDRLFFRTTRVCGTVLRLLRRFRTVRRVKENDRQTKECKQQSSDKTHCNQMVVPVNHDRPFFKDGARERNCQAKV